MGGKTCTLPQREVPLLAEVDVAVAGGGFPGVCAAVAAARLGARVAIVERDGNLGGQAAEIYYFGLSGFIDNNGVQFVKGVPWEVMQRTLAEGQSDPLWNLIDPQRMEREGLAAEMARFGLPATPSKGHTHADPNAFRYVLQTMAHEEGITTSLETPLSDVLLDGQRIVGVVAMGGYGPFAIEADVVVDTTPQAVVAALAGKPFPYPEAYMGTHPRVAGVDIERLLQYVADNRDDVQVAAVEPQDLDYLRGLVECGIGLWMGGFGKARQKAVQDDPLFEITGAVYRNSDPGKTLMFYYERDGTGTYWVHSPGRRRIRLDESLHLSQTIAHFRRQQWLTHKLFREYVPGFEKAHLMDIHPHTGRALRRSPDPGGFTEYDVPWEHIKEDGNLYEDSVARVMGHHDTGAATEGWQLPYRSLIPKGLEGILVTGKPACRWLHTHGTHAAVAQAAGVAAALASKEGVPLRELDVSKVQAALEKQGAVVF